MDVVVCDVCRRTLWCHERWICFLATWSESTYFSNQQPINQLNLWIFHFDFPSKLDYCVCERVNSMMMAMTNARASRKSTTSDAGTWTPLNSGRKSWNFNFSCRNESAADSPKHAYLFFLSFVGQECCRYSSSSFSGDKAVRTRNVCVCLSWACIDCACGRQAVCVRPKVVSCWNRKGQKSSSKQQKKQTKKKHHPCQFDIAHALSVCDWVSYPQNSPQCSSSLSMFFSFAFFWLFNFVSLSLPKVFYDDNDAQSRTKVNWEIVVCVFPFPAPNRIRQTLMKYSLNGIILRTFPYLCQCAII